MGRHKLIAPDAILDAAEAVVLRDGAARMTLEAVAAEARISKGSVLYDYGTKDRLIAAMVERYAVKYSEALAAAAQAQDHPNADALAHIEVHETLPEQDRRRAASLFAALISNRVALDAMRQFYAEAFGTIDVNDPARKRALLAMLAVEGLGWLETFGLLELSKETRAGVLAEMRRLVQNASET